MGDPQWVDGYFGGGLEFDQAGDEVNVPYHADLNQDAFTVCAWANVEPGSTGYRALISLSHQPPVNGYIFFVVADNTWQLWMGAGDEAEWDGIAVPAVEFGEWQHITGTYVDNKLRLYINGELFTEYELVDAFIVNSQQELLIGASANESDTHNYRFKGKIDEVHIYDRELSEDEIATVMETQVTAVETSGKIALTWGQLKEK